MDLNGFSSPRSDRFPAGLRVLVVDDDPTWLKILEKMLKKCNYEVTTCSLARDALNLLRERKDGFDIVISDVTMPDMDGFKLLEHVGLEMDLPVIMMSVDGETIRVMKGVQHGACDYLLKPIRMKELRNIWQHVFRKRMHEVRDVEIHDSLDEVRAMMRHGNEPSDDVYLFNRDTAVSAKRRKDDHHNKYNDRVSLDSHSSAAKKARVVWSVDLHQKFVKAVNQIGFDKVGPKKILDLMGVPWLTRENVASHLQKYRLYLSRLEKEREQLDDTFAGIIQHSSSRSPQDFDLGHKIPPMVHELDPKVSEPNSNVVRTISLSEPEKHLIIDKADVSRKITSSRLNVNHRVDSPNSCVESEVGPTIQLRDSTSSVRQFKTGSISHNQPHLSRSKSDELVKAGFDGSGKVTYAKVESMSALFSVQPENLFHATEQIQSSMWTSDAKSFQGNLTLGTGSCTRLWDEEFDPHYFSQVDYYQQIDDFGNIEPLDCSRQEVFGDVQTHIYAPWNFDYEYLNETVEYPIMDRGLFIA